MAVFALVDCNNFYASCERVFVPGLKNRPVAVLSNNDGCVIARSAEVKALGVPLGAPAYKCERLFRQHNVALFSSNYALYGDMSARVMRTLARFSPNVEIYSIDEAFLDLEGMARSKTQLLGYARHIQTTVQRWTGIPVSVGLGPTKTLAKLANRYSKQHPEQNGVAWIGAERRYDAILSDIATADIWGVGRRYAKMLARFNVRDARRFKYSDRDWIRRKMTVGGLHTVLELNGVSCIPLEQVPPDKKAICSSRSFGRPVRSLTELKEATACYVSRAAKKLRSQNSVASEVLVYLHTNTFKKNEPQYSNATSSSLPQATAFTPTLVNLVHEGLDRIYRPGFAYKKTGVLLSGLERETNRHLSLFEIDSPDTERSATLMKTLDRINTRYGTGSLAIAAAGQPRKKLPWHMQRNHLSPGYTTSWDELPVVG